MTEPLPSYADLMERTDAPPGSSWGLFGPGDELGTVNFLTADRRRRAAGLVRSGKSFNLDWPIDAFDPPTSGLRKPATHTIFAKHPNNRDDYLDEFYLQGSSQLDGLRHQRHPRYGFYNGRDEAEIVVGNPTLGVQRWRDQGIVGRGVLLDIERAAAATGRPLNHHLAEPFTVDVLERAATDQGVAFERGDILLLHTGWSRFYLCELDGEQRAEFAREIRSTGLIQSRETLAWLWDHRISVLASDNVGVERLPVVADSPFVDAHGGMMHQEMIPLLGLCLGELWSLEALATDCAQDGVYECMVISTPLDLVGGVGSPANAMALK